MNKITKYIFFSLLLISGISLFSGNSGRTNLYWKSDEAFYQVPQDSSTRYPVKKTQITTYQDLEEKTPIDLRDPSNIKTEVEYDIRNNVYLFKTKVGDEEWVTPFTLTPDEYNEYTLKQSMHSYFRTKNAESFERGTSDEEYGLKDIRVPIGAAERIFGPGGVKIRPQGYAEFSMGIKHSTTDDPTRSENNRSKTMFDVDQKIQLNVNASIGDKMSFDLNYDTEAVFDFDSKKLKLAYEGNEDEIIRYLEAGNVSLNTTNSLISGANALFGIRADLQFGKLRVNTVVSQQESESQTVGSKGGVQTTSYEFKADNYDENRHFFLGFYFRDNYDEALSKLPHIKSPISIDKIEVWITNRRDNPEARNIVAFADLAEKDKIHNTNQWTAIVGADNYPNNNSNNLYSRIITEYPGIRNNSDVNKILSDSLESGLDYEKIDNARLLSSSEYSYNPQLGYISLNTALQNGEVLAVAYSYTLNGNTYQVGEFSTDMNEKDEENNEVKKKELNTLIVKLLKPVSLYPESYTWDLMMKNIYSLNAYNVQSDRFRLNISYQSDTLGTYIDYFPEPGLKISNERFLRIMELDNLDSRQNRIDKSGDGIFDFVEGITIRSSRGQIIFPVVEPFGNYLRKKINSDSIIANKYVYDELYRLTLTEARQAAEKNKFKISGTYRANNANEIDLNAQNVARGSVRVTAGGTLLTEGTHYTVDYVSGKVSIIDQSIIDAGTAINVSLENQTLYSMQRKTLLGLNLSYDFTRNFTVGTTFMHMYSKPLTTKTEIGSESVKNTLVGFNTSYRTESQWLTNLIDKIPFVNATAPSQIAFTGEVAKMFPGHYKNKYAGGYSYLDDFESSRSRIILRDPYGWKLAATPTGNFEEGTLSDQIEYGMNRAHLAWFTIDNIFTRNNSSLTPQHIKNDKDQLSNHFVREIETSELYPERTTLYNESSRIPALNISYYPEQRGPYNVDADNITSEGKLKNPAKRWGGIFRKIDQNDFEAINVEYIEFWLMDPFVYDKENGTDNKGGTLYFNLGEVSEDILKDGKKFYENGLSTNDPDAFTTTVWGKVPTRQSTVYAFDNNADMSVVDVGLDGLSTEEELEFPTYREYVEKLRSRLSAEAIARMENDPFSPLNDPAGDNYHYFRGGDYDRDEVSILDRYKYYNGTEGNSTNNSNDSYSDASVRTPDVEDINQDNTMNETEAYYQYKVKLYPDMDVDHKYIADKREVNVNLKNGKTETITWYQFKIPITEPDTVVGRISNYNSIRFIRMFLTDFEKETHLRFGTLELVRGEWRVYTQSLNEDLVSDEGTITVSSVNIEENSSRQPVNYVLPPGESRIVDPSQPQLRQENEQSLVLQIEDLDPNAARAVYRNTFYDLRRYKRIQMFVHAENMVGKDNLSKGDFSVFIRLGSDYKNNYYEYEIPLTITPEGRYNGNNYADQLAVWPEENMFDFPLELLKNIKLDRNKEKRKSGSTITYNEIYRGYDPDKPNNIVKVIGNPSLAEVEVIMIGIRNNSRYTRSAEIWVNELRVADFDEEGGWAAQGNLNIAFSDIGTLTVNGRKETAGFGSIEQSLTQRRQDDYGIYSISTNVDVGRFLPERIKASIPLYYTYTNETTTPKYDPLDQDVTLKEALSLVETKAQKDSIKNLSQTKTVTKNLSFSNVKLNIRSETPMPYDPANFSIGYAQNISESSDPTTVYDLTKEYKASFNYNYSPIMKTWKPFANTKSKAPMSKYAKNFGINYLPSNISVNSYITRYYVETAIRDLEGYNLGSEEKMRNFTTSSGESYWDRDFNLTWDFTKNLKTSFYSGTKAEIEPLTRENGEPYLQVNKKLDRDQYDEWKDQFWRNIRNFGTPFTYSQAAKVSYILPFSDIPFLDWANTSANYESTYGWEKGASIDKNTQLGNTIHNTMTITINNRFNLVNLYNKSSFLKKVNQKFGGQTSQRGNQTSRTNRNREERKPRRFEQEVSLKPDTTVTVKHNLNTKNIKVTARREDTNRLYNIKFKKTDNNTIVITTQDTVNIKLNILPGRPAEETVWYKIAEYSARGLMSVRTVSVNYSRRKSNYIYNFKPDIGDFFGQSSNMTPGLGFAFGFDGGEEFVTKALNREWMLTSDDENAYNATPAIFSVAEKLDIKAQLEPVRGLKIDLDALREKEDRVNFYANSKPDSENNLRTLGGSFSMSIISLSTAFQSTNAKNGYHSDAFQKFLDYREILGKRIEKKYEGRNFPNNQKYNGEGVKQNSSQVLIPAFLAAYTGKDPGKISLSPFPSLKSMMPNWTVTYDGLTTLPWFKDKFKSIKLTHGYKSQYRVMNYSSYSSWEESRGNLTGFIQNPLATDDNSAFIPSWVYDISSVTITELFNPLFGAEATLNNSMTLRAKYNKGRTLTLNISSYQIVEALQNEFVIGMGYRINEFNRVIGLASRGQEGFNNDLNITADLSHKTNQTLLRKIEENYSQATAGTTITTIKLSADYALSRALTLRGYFDRVLNKPLISASSYPTTNTSFGISIRFTLTQ